MNDYQNEPGCNVCDGPLMLLGSLGKLDWFRCRDCGMEFRVEEKE